MTPTTKQDIFDVVRRYLEPHQPQNYRLQIITDACRQEDDWWYIVVQPDRDEVQAFEYALILNVMEQELQEKEGLKVLLFPVSPEEKS